MSTPLSILPRGIARRIPAGQTARESLGLGACRACRPSASPRPTRYVPSRVGARSWSTSARPPSAGPSTSPAGAGRPISGRSRARRIASCITSATRSPGSCTWCRTTARRSTSCPSRSTRSRRVTTRGSSATSRGSRSNGPARAIFGIPAEGPGESILLTVLFTDIVDFDRDPAARRRCRLARPADHPQPAPARRAQHVPWARGRDDR